MARLPRLSVAGELHRVIWRGHNHQAVFGDAADRQDFLSLLSQHARQQQVQVHAYVLGDDGVDLLVTPATPDGLPSLMQAIGRAYVRRFNHKYGRQGTLWEGRYRSTVMESDFLLPCMVSMDTVPVGRGWADTPLQYPWSSHAHYIGVRPEAWLAPHERYWALGNTPFAREAAYAECVRQGIAPHQQRTLEDAALKGWALGSPAYLNRLAERTGRRLEKGRPGRPPRQA